jgi:hypothetical protein
VNEHLLASAKTLVISRLIDNSQRKKLELEKR